mgnify:CR=1 FL=1
MSVPRLEDLDIETRALAESAAAREGIPVDAWLARTFGHGAPETDAAPTPAPVTRDTDARLRRQVAAGAARLTHLLGDVDPRAVVERIPAFLREVPEPPEPAPRTPRGGRRALAACLALLLLGGAGTHLAGHPRVAPHLPAEARAAHAHLADRAAVLRDWSHERITALVAKLERPAE